MVIRVKGRISFKDLSNWSLSCLASSRDYEGLISSRSLTEVTEVPVYVIPGAVCWHEFVSQRRETP